MSAALATRPATLEDLLQEPGKAELIGGKIVRFMATGDIPSQASGAIYFSLRLYLRSSGLPGLAVTDNAGFACDLPHRKSFSPDASYYTGPRSGMRFYPQPPVFAVEIRSENDYGPQAEREMRDKRTDYFAAGTEVIWDVDLQSVEATIRKFTPEHGPDFPITIFSRSGIADAEPAVPGWQMPVEELFVP